MNSYMLEEFRGTLQQGSFMKEFIFEVQLQKMGIILGIGESGLSVESNRLGKNRHKGKDYIL